MLVMHIASNSTSTNGNCNSETSTVTQVRRLCRGPCFGDPTVTEEDRNWQPDSEDEGVGPGEAVDHEDTAGKGARVRGDDCR